MNTYPMRSPLVVADFLISRSLCGRVVEVGSRFGDIMSCVKPFASQVISIEVKPSYCTALRERGIDVLCEALSEANAKRLLPDAEIYFFWLDPNEISNMRFVKLIHNELVSRNQSAQVIFLVDESVDQGEVGKQMTALERAGFSFGGKAHRLFFDETVDETQAITGRPLADGGNHASYKRPWAGRSGRWGVMTALVVDVGSQEGRERMMQQ
eukprot:3950086-Pleurochrysis_carterae.AAC.1